MRKLLFIVAYLFCTLSFATDYIRVVGVGGTFEDAKKQAFRKAIEFKVGVTVLSEVETQNYQRVRDEIYVYSDGYVDDYKVVSQRQTSQGILVEMDAKVSASKIKNRIIGTGKNTQEFAGDKHNAQAMTFIEQREQGDRLLEKVMRDFPSKAFTVGQSAPEIIIKEYVNYIQIHYSLSWDY